MQLYDNADLEMGTVLGTEDGGEVWMDYHTNSFADSVLIDTSWLLDVPSGEGHCWSPYTWEFPLREPPVFEKGLEP